MRTEFTPGQWTIQNRMTCGEGWAVASDHDFNGKTKPYRVYVCQIIGSERDAHLFAAARDLYEAVAGLIHQEEHTDNALDFTDAKAALAKARGEKS